MKQHYLSFVIVFTLFFVVSSCGDSDKNDVRKIELEDDGGNPGNDEDKNPGDDEDQPIEQDNEDDKNEADVNDQFLAGTNWKLLGIVDIRTGTFRIVERESCSYCYTITFDTDSTAFGISIVNYHY